MKALLNKCLVSVFSLGLLQGSAFGDLSKEKLFSNPALISAKVSPDGRTIAYVGADDSGISNLFIGEGESLTSFTTPEITQFFWSSDSEQVLLLRDESGGGRQSLYGVDIATKGLVKYAENATVVQIAGDKKIAVIGIKNRNPYFYDLYSLDLNSGNSELLFQNDEYAKFLFDDELNLILKMRISEEDGSWKILTVSDALFMELSSEDAFQTEILSYNGKNKSVYLLDNRFSDMNQLVEKPLALGEIAKQLAVPTNSDVDDLLFIGGVPRAYASYYEQKQWHLIDPSFEKEVKFLESALGSSFEVINSSSSGDVWVVANDEPDKGKQFWRFEASSQTLVPLNASISEEGAFSKMYSMVVTARDGKELVCYYTLPKEYDKGGVVEKPIPLVVVPHGGPFKARDKYEFDPYHQWLSSCGYAVLSVNFRLSSGFGKEFVNAGNGEWGGKAHLDVIDAVEACIAKGITEKGKLAILGGSYGGYESLASLTFSPGYFACCVAICGPSNLKTVLDSLPKFWEFPSGRLGDRTVFFTKQAFITSMGGNPDDPKGNEYLQSRSPLNFLDAIQDPLLLIHGKQDHVVCENEAKQFYDRMSANHKEITYILFPDEGHGFMRFPNKMFCMDRVERFLSEHLGGAYRPVDPSIMAKSSAQVFKGEDDTMKFREEVVQKPDIWVVGIECRTVNTPERAPHDIGKLWGRFGSEGIIDKIPNKVSNDIIALYCDYEGDYTKPYTVVIGCPVGSSDAIPEGMVAKIIPGGSYTVFHAKGEHPTSVIATWGKIWSDPNLERAYTGDYEVYGEKFFSRAPQEVEVYIATAPDRS